MKNSKPLTVLLSTIMLLAFIPGITSVHAVGQLYISPAAQGPFALKSSFTIQVKVANMDPFNGWDIYVKTDSKVIDPTSISVAGNLLVANFSSPVVELVNCVDNAGFGCGSNDGPGIAHSQLTVLGPVPMTKPTSGLLFTITYTVAGSGSSTVHLFNDLLFNGSPFAVPHTSVDGTYGPLPDFTITASPVSQSITQGQTASSTMTVASLNSFSGMVSLSASASPSVTNGPAATIDPMVTVKSGTLGTSIMNVTTTTMTPPGSYTITITGVSGSLSHTATFLVDVIALTAPDFTVFVSPTFLPTVLASYPSCCATVNVTSLNGFSGTVTLTQNTSPAPNNAPFATFSTDTVTLSPGQKVLVAATIHSFALTPTPAPSPKQVYTVEIVGTSGTLTHAGLAIVNVQPAVFQRGKIDFLRDVSLTKDGGIQTVSVKVQNNSTQDVLGQLIVRLRDPSDPLCSQTVFISTPITLPHGNVTANIPGVQEIMSVTINLNTDIGPTCLPAGDTFTLRAFATFSGSVLASTDCIFASCTPNQLGHNGLGGTLAPIVGTSPLKAAVGAFGFGARSGGFSKQDRGTFDVLP